MTSDLDNPAFDLPLEERRRSRRRDLEPIDTTGVPWAKHAREVEPASDEAIAEASRPDVAGTVERRSRAMLAAGPVDPDAVAVAAPSLDRCPRVDGHPGSCAAAEAVERFLLEPRLRTCALLGGAGRGKTWAAVWACTVRGAVWHPANDVRIPIWDEKRSRCASAALLVIDDLGTEPNDWAARELCDLVESRHNRGAKTVFTSNRPVRLEDLPEAHRGAWKGRTLADRYGDRFVSRVLDVQRSIVVRCTGPDMRRAPPESR